MTKQLLWQEYRGQSPEGYQYSHFCSRQAWAKRLPLTATGRFVARGFDAEEREHLQNWFRA